ncbi:MAG: flotillin family protein [Planctomycetes bacterium]|nr:flotillin family protein [Planctomycetota bacterium]
MTPFVTIASVPTMVIFAAVIFGVVVVFGLLGMFIKCFVKVEQGSALIRTGMSGTKVSFTGMFIVPVIHRQEIMDISVKRIEIDRMGVNGLVCKDNMRADVKVAFFVRVNKSQDHVLRVAECLGCARASAPQALVEFFDAKFSEALKSVGKQFDFVELYTNRQRFKEEILKVIGTDLNGYILDDAAIDYLEQTPIDKLDPRNILDAEGIKKITDLTAKQAILANDIEREKEKTIKKQDVEARETILELERQQAEAEQKQKREILEVTAREMAAAQQVESEEKLKSEAARIHTEEEVAVKEENKQRQIIVAQRNKERTDKVELERIEKDRALEQTERERVVTLAQIEKDKAVEVEKKNIQDVIRERVAVERTVVEEEQHILDTREFATADRAKKVAVTKASEQAEMDKVKKTVSAEAEKLAAREQAEQLVIEAEAQRTASEKEADARKILADAKAQEEAVLGMGEARALEAKAHATEQYGTAEATVIEKKGIAEAKAMELKFTADATGIKEKAEAMKLFDGVGREHEEFKLNLNKDLQIQLKAIDVQREIAEQQASIVGEALKQAKIDIVGGDGQFFDKIVSSITQGKQVDRLVDSSDALSDIKKTFFNGDGDNFKHQIQKFIGRFGMSTEDVKNLTVSALLAKLFGMADSDDTKLALQGMATAAQHAGLADRMVGGLLGKSVK